MNIIRAEHLGMCFGVRDAIALAEEKARQEPLTILGDIVHNEIVVERLRNQGIQIEKDPSKVTTRTAMVTAHGASEVSMSRARGFGLNLLQGTCPLVHHAHKAVARLVAAGYYPVIIGKRGHVEVRGLTEDLAQFDIVECRADIELLGEHAKMGVVAQTTQPLDRVLYFLDLIRERFPKSEVRFMDTVCQPTKQRQRAAQELAMKSDVVIVIGGKNSNNTHELVQTCLRCCSRVHHVQQASDIQADWLKDAKVVGITAGTSTPDVVIDSVEAQLRRLA